MVIACPSLLHPLEEGGVGHGAPLGSGYGEDRQWARIPARSGQGPVTVIACGTLTSTTSPACSVVLAMTAATSSYFAPRFVAGPKRNVMGVSRCSDTHPTELTWITETCQANAGGHVAATRSPGSAAPDTWSRGEGPPEASALNSILGSVSFGCSGPRRRPVMSTRTSTPCVPTTTATGRRSATRIDTVCGQLTDTDAVAIHGNADSMRSRIDVGSIDTIGGADESPAARSIWRALSWCSPVTSTVVAENSLECKAA